MSDDHGHLRRRVTWRYDESATSTTVADALLAVARYEITDGWSPQRLLVTSDVGGFHVHLDLAKEDTGE